MKKRGPWTIKSSEVKYKSPWVEVSEDAVVRPDGKDGIYTTIRIKTGISVVPIDDESNVYLVEEFKYPMERNIIETATGAMEEAEKPLEAAQRELKEELGIQASDWIDLGPTYPLTSYMNAPNFLFLARKLTFGQRQLDGDESMKTLKIPFEEAVAMCLDGRIENQKTTMCILKVNEYLKNSAL